MNAPANVPAKRTDHPIEQIKAVVARKAEDFKMVLPSHITVDKFQRTIATAALSNQQLLKCDRQSLLIACMKLAQDGLLPDGREAALVPFKTRVKVGEGRNDWSDSWQVQAMPMAWGLRKKILQSGEVVSLETGVVYRAEMESGHFIYEIGIDPPIRHRPKLDLTAEECADDQIVAAYSIARIKNENGDPYWSVEVMRRSEVDKVRQTSQTGALGKTDRQGRAIPPKGPWVDWYGEMARKTVLRRHSKVLPMSGDLLDTLERDDAEEARAAGAAKMLEIMPDDPVVLPSDGPDDDDDGGVNDVVDAETGEVLPRDSRGMTEVDEETARALDAGERIDETQRTADMIDKPLDQRWEGEPEAEYYGPKPGRASAGERWFDRENDKLRFAHETPNGIKWYLKPQEPEASDGTLSADNPAAAEGKADEDRGEAEAKQDRPPWMNAVERAMEGCRAAGTIAAINAVDQEWQKHVVAVPDDQAKRVNDMIAATRRELRDREGS